MNILDIPVAAVFSLGKGLPIMYPSNHSQEEADFDSIALVGHEAESNFHGVQQMDAKTTDVLEELNLKYGVGRITEDQICPKCGEKLTAIPKASMRGTMVFCRSMPTTVCFVKIVLRKTGGAISGEMKTKDKINILHYNEAKTLLLRLRSD